jgi:ribosomal protein S18 acetylase RimI-like enzyme
MLKYWLILLIALTGTIRGISHDKPCDFQKNGIDYVWESEPNHSESKRVFLNAFIKCYDQVPLDALRQPSREAVAQWLDNAFEITYADYKNSNSRLWISAKANDRVVGFLVIDTEKHPEKIYLAVLAIDPAYQGRGIASSMIRSLFSQFPECKKFVVNTRHINEESKKLYLSLGFVASSYMHEGHNPELYAGFEYINPEK